MIISHRYRFIFIKTRKTAGTSIEVYLSQHCGPEDVVTPILPPVEGHAARNDRGLFNPLRGITGASRAERLLTLRDLWRRRRFYNHIHARTVRHRVGGKVWKRYFKFCVERNPWDKTLSHFHMKNGRSAKERSLDEYLAAGDYCLNYPQYMDGSGHRLLADRVVRFEKLVAELGEVFGMLGVPFEGTLDVRAKAQSRKDRRHYREIYSDKQRRIVERAFAKEIRLHGYSF
jgi:hypothetical protein